MRLFTKLITLITLATLSLPIHPSTHPPFSPPLTNAQEDAAAARRTEANRLLQRGIQQFQTSQFREALQSLGQALAIYREIGDRRGESNSLGSLGIAYHSLSQYERAIDLLQQALVIKQEIGDRRGEARLMGNLGVATFSLGQYERTIAFHQKFLAIALEIGDRRGAAASLVNLSNAYNSIGRYELAVDFSQQALAIFREIRDHRGEAKSLGNIGVAYRALGQYELAINFLQQSLAITREIGDRQQASISLGNLGVAYRSLGQYELAIDFYQQSLAIALEIGDRNETANSLDGLGTIYRSLGQYELAIDFHQQSLGIKRDIGDRQGEANSLGNLGNTYSSLGQYELAIDFHQQSLGIKRDIGDRQGEAVSLSNLGRACGASGQYECAIDFSQQALDIFREIDDRKGEAISLGNLGTAYHSLSQYERAISFYQQSLTLTQAIGNQAEIASILSNLGRNFTKLDQPELAIIFLKASVDVRESIRGDIRGLDINLQQSFTDTVANSYRFLTDLLLQQDRVLEVQRVLDLLKVQELQDYLENVRGNARTASGIDFYQSEQEILARYNDLQASAIEVGRQLAELNQKDTEVGLTSDETDQRDALYQVQKDILTQFNGFADAPEIKPLLDQLKRVEGALSLEDINSLRNQLAALNAVLIYPLVLDDRIELVITTPDSAPLRRTVENVGRAELNSAIRQFREALERPSTDAKTPAYQLYRWLIEPLEADLADADLDTILYAPDGPLRYIPLAALYDSADPENGQWIAERFQVNNITATSLQELDTQPPSNPRILAGAFADSSTVHPVSIGDRIVDFRGLPFAGVEVATLAETLTNIRTYLDSEFSLKTLEPQLNNFNILHFATHAALVPKDAGETFILFGNGDRPTIKDIANWSLENVDLVVLSACETGLGGFDNNGEQILGLGYQFQQVGARAVIASLWQVDDVGAQALMNAFYLALRNDYSKTEALQRAQLALINDNLSFVDEPRGSIQVVDANTGEPISRRGASDHPYYWAPFILIGNGL